MLYKGVKSIKSLSILDRMNAIMLSLKGAMIPAEIILSPDTYQNVMTDPTIQKEIKAGKDALSVLKGYFATPITIKEENTDVIIAKELFPNPCPICGQRLPFLREMLERIEAGITNKVHCPLGHRYDGKIKIYYLNIFQTQPSETKAVQTCPQCGSHRIQYLSPTDVFCLDCAWDNLKRI